MVPSGRPAVVRCWIRGFQPTGPVLGVFTAVLRGRRSDVSLKILGFICESNPYQVLAPVGHLETTYGATPRYKRIC